MRTRFIFLFSLVAAWASLSAAPARQPGQLAQFDNFPLDESLILYIDSEANLALENIDSGAVARLTSGVAVAGYHVSPTRQTILYHDSAGAAYLITLEFFTDGRLTVSPPAGPFAAPTWVVEWAPDGTKLAYEGEGSQPVAITARGEALPLPEGVLAFGGWSYDSRWLAYCDGSDQLGVVDPAGASQVVAGGVDCPPSLGMNMSWSPTAPQLAYAIGDSTEGFMDAYVHDFATGETHSLSLTGELMGWSPSGRALAIGVGRVGAAGYIPSVTVVDPQGQRAQTLPEITTATAGVIGWLDRPTSMPIFGRNFVAEDLGFTERIGDAVFDASADGAEPLWGVTDRYSMAIVCGEPRFAGETIFSAPYPVLPAPGSPNMGAMRPYPGVDARMAPDGRTALVRAFTGPSETEGDWELHLLTCRDGAPLLKQAGGGPNWVAGSPYSADSRLLILMSSAGGGLVSQIFEIAGDGVILRRTFDGYPDDFEWLVTPTAAPPISQAGNSVSPLEPITLTAPPPQTGQFAFADGGNIWLINADGSDRRQITSSGADCCPAWSPGGNLLYFVRNPQTHSSTTDATGIIIVYDFATGQERAIDTGVSVSDDLAVSPDGRRLLFGDSGWTEHEQFGQVHKGCLHLLDMDTGEDTILDCEAPGGIYSVDFSPNEPAFAAEIGTFDISVLTFYASPTAIPNTDHEICCRDLDFASNGTGMVTVEEVDLLREYQLNYYERPDEKPTTLLFTNKLLTDPDISPNGDRLLYSHDGTIEIMSLPSRARTPVVAGHGPAWRPTQATAGGETLPGENPGQPVTTDTGTTAAELANDAAVDTGTTTSSPAARSRQTGSGMTGIVVILMALGLFAWGVYVTRK